MELVRGSDVATILPSDTLLLLLLAYSIIRVYLFSIYFKLGYTGRQRPKITTNNNKKNSAGELIMGCISDAQTPRGANEHIFQPELVSTCWHRGGRAFVLIPACRFVRVQLQISRYELSNSSNSTHNVIRGEQSRK